MSFLKVDNLNIEYSTIQGSLRAVRGVSFTVEPEETLGIVGESGCGKTTIGLSLLRMLPSNGRISNGSIMLDGTDLLKLSDDEQRRMRWNKISMIFQGAMNALNPVIRVGDLLTEVLQTHEKVSNEEAKTRIAGLFESVSLPSNRMTFYPFQLSGGMRQRVVIALSLLCNPQLVIADEPTTAFDVVVQDQVLGMIENIKKERGLGMIFITHDIAVVAETCQRVVVMYAGEIVEEGKVEDIFNDPRHPYTRALLSSVPSLTGVRHRLQSLPGHPPDLINVPLGCAFAPRCHAAENICRTEPPQLTPINTSKHHARCHFALDFDRLTRNERRTNDEISSTIVEGTSIEGQEQTILQIDGISKFYYHSKSMKSSIFKSKESFVRAVDGVDLSIKEGEVLALVGESGSGKSTLGRLICALDSPTGGRIRFKGADLKNMKGLSLKKLRQQIQMVFQDPYSSLDPRCTVYETVSEPLVIQGVPSKERRVQVAKILEDVKLSPYSLFINRFPHELSGGERQRVALARALILKPSLIIADEPVSMVDASMRAGLVNLMLELHKSYEITYLFITHDLSIARHIAHRIAIMYLGRIIEIGGSDTVIKNPMHPYTQMLISAVAIPDPNARKQRVKTVIDPSNTIEIMSGCHFHPRCIYAKTKCRTQKPTLNQLSPNHSVACFYPLE